jgi:carboxypeptidase N regulatory subunit
LPADIAYLPFLRHLDVSYNRIRSIDRCLLSNARRLDFVNLRENPFHCDCSLFWLRGLRATVMSRWTDRRASVPFVPGRCWTPTELRGVSVTNWLSLDCVQSAAAAASSSSGTSRDPSWLPSGSTEWDRCNRV